MYDRTGKNNGFPFLDILGYLISLYLHCKTFTHNQKVQSFQPITHPVGWAAIDKCKISLKGVWFVFAFYLFIISNNYFLQGCPLHEALSASKW